MKNRCAVYNNILEVIGNTPMVRLNRVIGGHDSEVFAKLEFLNPMGSVKDRIAKHMVEEAEKDGRLKPGQLIIENSSGNTALGLAMVTSQKGYRLKVVVRDSISKEKVDQLTALGVDTIKVDSTLPPESPDSYNNITPRIAAETPGCYFPDQHNNRENNNTHYLTTGPEIWQQMDGRIDYMVAGVGTGGTLCGVARFLKEKDPSIQIVAVDPLGSIFYDYYHKRGPLKSQPYLLEGLGDEYIIKTVDFNLIDEMYQVNDSQAFRCARRLLKEEGIAAGGSSGAALWGVIKLLESIEKRVRIVTIFPDNANRYLSTIFNDHWLKKKGLLE